jgi:hypothetical protein
MHLQTGHFPQFSLKTCLASKIARPNTLVIEEKLGNVVKVAVYWTPNVVAEILNYSDIISLSNGETMHYKICFCI